MANVTMTIKEYNELRDEMIRYKRALEELMTPEVDRWSLEWFEEHKEAEITVRSCNVLNMSFETRQVVLPIIYRTIEEKFGDIGEHIVESACFELGRIQHYQEETKEVVE